MQSFVIRLWMQQNIISTKERYGMWYNDLLSHLGYQYKEEKEKISDLLLARETEHIDLIIGYRIHNF